MSGRADSTNPAPLRFSLLIAPIFAGFVCLGGAIDASASSRSDYELGAAAFKTKQYAKAQSYFEAGLKQTDADPNLHYGLASVLQASGQNERASAEYRRCIALAPNSKLADYSRSGLGYIESKQMATMAPLPEPTPARFSPDHQSRPWRLRNAIAMAPGPMPLAPGLPPSTLQTSSGGFPGSGGWSRSLPRPTPSSYGPGAGVPFDDVIAFSSRGRRYLPAHRGYNGYRGGGSAYSRYAFGTPYTPVMQIRTYGYVPPLNGRDPNAQNQSETPPVELMAKQGKLVIDEQK